MEISVLTPKTRNPRILALVSKLWIINELFNSYRGDFSEKSDLSILLCLILSFNNRENK